MMKKLTIQVDTDKIRNTLRGHIDFKIKEENYELESVIDQWNFDEKIKINNEKFQIIAYALRTNPDNSITFDYFFVNKTNMLEHGTIHLIKK